MKKLGLLSVIFLGINSMLGSGIFLLPGQVTALVGIWSLLTYGFVTVLALAIAWCYTQCSSHFERNGGGYLYAKKAFGDFIGFEIGIMRYVVAIIAWASLAVGLVTAINALFPLTVAVQHALIVAIVGSLTALNCLDFRMMTLLNNLMTVAKLIPLIFFVAVGAFFIHPEHFAALPAATLTPHSFGESALVIFYAFAGFESLVLVAGEMENPKRNMVRAVMATLIICALLYFFIQCVAIGALGAALATSTLPISDVATRVLGHYGTLLISGAMLVSIAGINVACSFLTPRYASSLAEDGMLPKILTRKNRFGAPFMAIVFTMLITIAIALSGTFLQLVMLSVVARFAQYVSTCLAAILFNKHQLTFTRLAIPLLALVGVLWLMFQTPSLQLLLGLSPLLLGIPYYFVRRKQLASSSQ